jgi:hypothetical protein
MTGAAQDKGWRMSQAELNPALAAALEALAGELALCAEPWWVVGSAAIALHGARRVEVRDIDLLVSRADAGVLLARRGAVAQPGVPDERFRSDIFACWDQSGIQVDLFAGFCVRSSGKWQELVPQTRQPVLLKASCLFVPSIAELIAWARLFGRDKDKAREAVLRPLLP